MSSLLTTFQFPWASIIIQSYICQQSPHEWNLNKTITYYQHKKQRIKPNQNTRKFIWSKPKRFTPKPFYNSQSHKPILIYIKMIQIMQMNDWYHTWIREKTFGHICNEWIINFVK